MKQEDKILKDRETTEKKILNAVGQIISDEGFEKVGVNAVARAANVSKVLIYRYFGGVDELIVKYIFEKDYWINISTSQEKIEDVKRFIKNLFRQQIAQLRKDVTLKRIYRWELSSNNHAIKNIREKREENAYQLVKMMSQLTKSSLEEVAALATIISASISYLALLEESCPVYNGINLQNDEGWEQVAKGIDLIVDLWIKDK